MPDADVKDIKLELKLDGSNWTDVSADVRASEEIIIRYGIFGHSPKNRVAGIGSMAWAMDNSEQNSGGLLGYYSPDHANKRTGFELNLAARVKVDVGTYYGERNYGDFYYGTSYVKFTGFIKRIDVMAGKYGKRLTKCVAYDYMWDLSKNKMDLLAVQETRRSDLLVGDIVGNLGDAPVSTSYETGQETFTFAADDLRDERSTALSALQKVAVSELGYVYVKGDNIDGGVLKFEDRHFRVGSDPLFILTDSEITQLKGSRKIDNLYNIIKAISYPREEGASNEVLWTYQTTLQINANSTETIIARYVDPDQKGIRIAGKSLVDLVAGTDYKFGSTEGGGNDDKQADLTVTETFGSNSAKLALQNTSGATGYVNLLQIRGIAIRIFEPITTISENSVSQTSYGEREFTMPLPYQDNHLVSKDFADSILADNKDPRQLITNLAVKEKDGLSSRAASHIEPGDRITLSETVLGIDAEDFFVHGINLRLQVPKTIEASWSIVVASAAQSWLLGKTNFTELGTNTILGA